MLFIFGKISTTWQKTQLLDLKKKNISAADE